MPNQQIINYIQSQLRSGVAIENIRISLLQSGWKQQDVEAAINIARQPIIPVQIQQPVQTVVSHPQMIQPTVAQTSQQIQPAQVQVETQIPAGLKSFVESKLQSGESKISIAASLKIAGWSEELINKALGMSNTVEIAGQTQKKQELVTPTPEVAIITTEDKKKKKDSDTAKIDHKIDLVENFSISAKFLKESFFTIIGIQIIPTVLIAFASSLFSAIGSLSSLTVALSVAAAGLILFFVIAVWSQTALIYAISTRERNIFSCYGKSLKKVFPLLITTISIIGIIISGTILFIIPAIIFGIWFAFAPFITIVENFKGAKALARSRNYVKGNFWMIFSRGFLILLLTGILLFALNSITSMLFPEPSIIKYLWILLQSCIQLVVTTFGLTFMFVLFESIKNTKTKLKESKQGFIWVIRILSWLGCASILLILGLGIYLLGNAIWDVLQELSATGELSMDMIREIINSR